VIIAIIVTNLIDAVLTWTCGQTTEQNPVFRMAIRGGVWAFIVIKTTMVLVMVGLGYWLWTQGGDYMAAGYGVALGVSVVILAINVNYVVTKKLL